MTTLKTYKKVFIRFYLLKSSTNILAIIKIGESILKWIIYNPYFRTIRPLIIELLLIIIMYFASEGQITMLSIQSNSPTIFIHSIPNTIYSCCTYSKGIIAACRMVFLNFEITNVFFAKGFIRQYESLLFTTFSTNDFPIFYLFNVLLLFFAPSEREGFERTLVEINSQYLS